MVSYEKLRGLFKVGVYRKGSPNEYFSAFCPWHDDRKTPSLMVHKTAAISPDGRIHGGYWECLAGCGSGGLDGLFRKLSNWTRDKTWDSQKELSAPPPPWIPPEREAMERMVEGAHQILEADQDLSWYLEQRGLDGRIGPCRLGYYEGWITVPVYDDRRNLKTVVLRATPPAEARHEVRFHSPTLAPELYVPNWAGFNRADTVALVFGMFDALTLDDMLIPVCTSTHGNDSFNLTWAMAMREKRVVMFPDSPPKEQEAAERLARSMKMLGIRVSIANLPYVEGVIKDPNGFFETGKRRQLEVEMVKWF